MRKIAALLGLISILGCGSGAVVAPSGGSEAGPFDGGLAPFDGAPRDSDATSPIADGSSSDGSSSDADSSRSDDAADATPIEASAGDGSEDAAATGPYGSDGASAVTTETFQVPSPNGTFTTTAYIPSGAGPFPVVVLSSGFFQSGIAYAPYAKRMASWGILTLLRDDPNLAETTPLLASDVGYTVSTWLAATNADTSSALHAKVDAARVGLAGHSRGGQVALLAGEGGAHGLIKGVFGLDPVDQSMGTDPEARTTLATIGVPLAFVGETTDSAASSCAPAADNYQVLYQAAASPAVAISAVNADHTMFEDPANCSFCTLCTAGTANAAQVLAYSVRYMTAFFARELLGDSSVGSAFQGAGASADVAAGLIQIVAK